VKTSVVGPIRLQVIVSISVFLWQTIASQMVLAAEDKLEENAAFGIAYDSNRLLEESPDDRFYGTRQRAGIKYYSDAERYRIDTGLKIVDEYLPESREDEVDQIKFDLGGVAKTRKSQLEAALHIQSDSTLAAEVQAAGFVNDNKDRLRAIGDLSYTYSLSEVDYFTAETSYETVNYEDILPGQLSEYVYKQLSGGYRRSISEWDNVQFSMFASELENDDLRTNSQTKGISLGWSRALNDVWNFDVSFGRRKSEYVRDLGWLEIENDNSSRVTDFKLKYKGYRWQYSLLGSYGILPGNAGELVNRKTIDMSFWHPLLEVVSLSGQLIYWQQRSDLTVTPGNDLDALQAYLALNWRLDSNLFLVTNLNRIDRRMLYEDDSVYSNGIVFEVVWASDPLFL